MTDGSGGNEVGTGAGMGVGDTDPPRAVRGGCASPYPPPGRATDGPSRDPRGRARTRVRGPRVAREDDEPVPPPARSDERKTGLADVVPAASRPYLRTTRRT